MSYSGTKYAAEPPRQTEEGSRLSSGLRDLGYLFSQLGDKLSAFLDYKTELLKSEVRETVKGYSRGGIFAASGGVVVLFGSLFLEAAIAFWLSLLFPFSVAANLALGFAIVALLDIVAGALLLYAGKKRFSQTTPVPQKSLHDLRKDKEWIQREVA